MRLLRAQFDTTERPTDCCYGCCCRGASIAVLHHCPVTSGDAHFGPLQSISYRAVGSSVVIAEALSNAVDCPAGACHGTVEPPGANTILVETPFSKFRRNQAARGGIREKSRSARSSVNTHKSFSH